MSKQPRVRIINHRVRDAGVGAANTAGSELTIPWERRQVLNDALAHLKRVISTIPDSVTTTNQVLTLKRALGAARQEMDLAIKLLMEKS